MKTTSENSLFVKYCLNRPFTVTFILVVMFLTALTLDQYLNSYRAVEKEAYSISHLNANYVAWTSTTPEIISYFKDAQSDSDGSKKGYFMSLKSTASSVINYAELQIRLVKKVIFLYK